MKQEQIIKKIKQIIKNENVIVIYSSFFEIFLEDNKSGEILLKNIIKLIKEESKKKTFLIPSFTIPKKLLNLNTERSISGILSNKIRKINKCERTLSAYFSF